MNYRKLIFDILLVTAISFIVVKLFSPKQQDNTVLWSDTQDRIELHERKMQDYERSLLSHTSQIKELTQQINEKQPQIIRVRSNRTASNSLVSAMSSDELTQLLAKRYQDSTKVKP